MTTVADTLSTIKKVQIALLIEAVSSKFFILRNIVGASSPQGLVMDEKKTDLIEVMTTYRVRQTEPQQIFDRDTAVSAITTAIDTSIKLLSTTTTPEDHTLIRSAFDDLVKAIKDYFEFANTTI